MIHLFMQVLLEIHRANARAAFIYVAHTDCLHSIQATVRYKSATNGLISIHQWKIGQIFKKRQNHPKSLSPENRVEKNDLDCDTATQFSAEALPLPKKQMLG